MRGLRIILARHRALAAILLALLLSVRLAVPAGFMIQADSRVLTVVICSGVDQHSQQLLIPLAGSHHGGKSDQRGGGDPCPYSALGMAGLAGADAPLLAVALAFILALGFVPARTARREAPPHLRPPLRGPPIPA
jgi:hypothetical protein